MLDVCKRPKNAIYPRWHLVLQCSLRLHQISSHSFPRPEEKVNRQFLFSACRNTFPSCERQVLHFGLRLHSFSGTSVFSLWHRYCTVLSSTFELSSRFISSSQIESTSHCTASTPKIMYLQPFASNTKLGLSSATCYTKTF